MMLAYQFFIVGPAYKTINVKFAYLFYIIGPVTRQ